MISILAVICCSFCLSLFLTPLCRNMARARGLVDTPDDSRKIHPLGIPRIGGVPIVLSGVITIALLMLAHTAGGDQVTQAIPSILLFLPSVLIIFAVGLLDDLLNLKPWQKFAGQFVAAAVAYWSGMSVHSVGPYPVNVWLAAPVTILWLLICTNAVNLIDGVDGLAAGVGLFAASTTLLGALIQGNFPLAVATAPLVGALAGFLRFNFNPASIFLGDSGSLTIGFLLGLYGVFWSHKSTTLLGMTAPIMALSIPLLDTAVAIIRRALRGQSIFLADRGHIHHRLLDRGHSKRRVAVILYSVSAIGASLSLLVNVTRGHVAGLVVLLFCGSVWAGIQHLGFVEFNCASAVLRSNMFGRIVNAQVELRAIEQKIISANDIDACWFTLRSASAQLGFSHVALHFDGILYEERQDGSLTQKCWTMNIPLTQNGFVELGCSFENSKDVVIVGAFADLLRHALDPKLKSLRSLGDPLRAGEKHALSILNFEAKV